MSVPVGLAVVWLVAGLAATWLLITETRRLLRKPITNTDVYCAAADETLDRNRHYDPPASLIRSGWLTASFEDAEVAMLDDIYELPPFEGER